MTGRAILVNIGFDPTATLEIIAATSLASNDLLVLVYPKTDDELSRLRSEQARTQIKSHVNILRATGRKIGIKELELDLTDISGAVDKLIETLIELKKRYFYVSFEFTGGVRAITVLMSLLSTWFPHLVDELTFVIEVTRVRKSIPIISPLQFTSKAAVNVLAFLADKKHVKRKDICRELGLSESYVSRIISSLKRHGILKESLRVVSLNDEFSLYVPIFKGLRNVLPIHEKTHPNLQDKKD